MCGSGGAPDTRMQEEEAARQRDLDLARAKRERDAQQNQLGQQRVDTTNELLRQAGLDQERLARDRANLTGELTADRPATLAASNASLDTAAAADRAAAAERQRTLEAAQRRASEG